MKCAAAVFILAFAACGTAFDEDSEDPPEPCNGDSALCERRLSDVSFPGTHNSFATKDRFQLLFRNQNDHIATQLEQGIRAIMLDTYWHKPLFKSHRAALCHQFCTTGGYTDLVPELEEMQLFLDANPREVVLLLIEPHSLSPQQFEEAMAEAGLLSRVYSHPSVQTEWPRLETLIEDDRRVVVFYENDPDEEPDDDAMPIPDFYHPLWDYAWETRYSARSIDDFSCEPNRGREGAPLYLVNHFLSEPAGRPDLARKANNWDVLGPRVQECEQWHLPNIIAVDYYDLDGVDDDGEYTVVRAADYLNGVGDDME